MSFHTTQAAFLRGWALVDQGRAQEGIAEMLQNISTDRAVQITPNYAVLAESLGKNARPEEGLAAVAEALREAERSGERILLPRLYGIQGELILVLKPSDEAQAERCFRTAIDIARSQKARWWELRATTSLARLLKLQGKTDEAREMLAQIYAWFTEGFDTADLRDAKALLEQLVA
jgi:predicted ATPase